MYYPSDQRQVSMLDMMTLLYNIRAGAEHPKVGFEDVVHTVATLSAALTRQKAYIETRDLESGLWSCNLMSECRKFWDPKGRTFEQFVADVLGRDERFHQFYNLIEKRDAK